MTSRRQQGEDPGPEWQQTGCGGDRWRRPSPGNGYYLLLMPIGCFILPTAVPVYFWNETWSNAWFVAAMFRYTFVLNVTWLVNSAAHKWGDKPYDKNISPVETKPVSLLVLGEGFHNYHHTFPWDYKTAELGNYSLNFSKLFIDAMAKIGWAYDLKTVSTDIIQKRVQRTATAAMLFGDGTTRMCRRKIGKSLTLYVLQRTAN